MCMKLCTMSVKINLLSMEFKCLYLPTHKMFEKICFDKFPNEGPGSKQVSISNNLNIISYVINQSTQLMKYQFQEGNRVRYNQSNYRRVYEDKPEQLEALTRSEEEPSLSDVVQRWLERTPGLSSDFDFASKYKEAVDKILNETLEEIEQETNAVKKQYLMSNYRKKKEQFESIFDQEVHAALVKRGERRFTHKALLGALMIVSYW